MISSAVDTDSTQNTVPWRSDRGYIKSPEVTKNTYTPHPVEKRLYSTYRPDYNPDYTKFLKSALVTERHQFWQQVDLLFARLDELKARRSQEVSGVSTDSTDTTDLITPVEIIKRLVAMIPFLCTLCGNLVHLS